MENKISGSLVVALVAFGHILGCGAKMLGCGAKMVPPAARAPSSAEAQVSFEDSCPPITPLPDDYLTRAGGTLLELTFDDGPDGSGLAFPADRINNLDNTTVKAYFRGGANRSSISGGRYGRAATFPSASAFITISGIKKPTPNTETKPASLWLTAWVKRQQTERDGLFFSAPGSFEIRISKTGQIIVAVFNTLSQTFQSFLTPQSIPPDGKFHHLRVESNFMTESSTFKVTVDFGPSQSMGSTPFVPSWGTMDVIVGKDLGGQIDELRITPNEAGGLVESEFDENPGFCPENLKCREDIAITRPRCWPNDVPVRTKTIYNPELCSAQKPCPLVFTVSGGGSCNDDYGDLTLILELVEQGFVVATIDPYCQLGSFVPYPHETSQFVVAKNQVINGPFAPIIADTKNYAATGCSHGSVVSLWAMQEADYPKRSFAQSGPMGGYHSAYHQGGMKSRFQYIFDYAVAQPSPHNENDALAMYWYNANLELVSRIDTQATADRELGGSWGAATETPPIGNGGFCGPEEAEGNTFSGRLTRDAWNAIQPNTGYFIENRINNCEHCILSPNTLPLRMCSYCFLKHGRKGMALACPDCLSDSLLK